MKKSDEVLADIERQKRLNDFGYYTCGCQIYGNTRKLCDRHFVMLNVGG